MPNDRQRAFRRHDTLDKINGLPRYRYSKSGERIDNLTDWNLDKFIAHYGNKVVSKDTMQDVTVHGFQSAFRDWAAKCIGYSHEVTEMALAHTIDNAGERAYRRGDLFDKRRRLVADWATYCASGAPAEGKVTPLRGGNYNRLIDD